MSDYVITAYRWGQRNGHSYVVGATDDLETAKTLAENHVQYRGGKYGCEVCECKFPDIEEGNAKQIAYFETPYFGAAGDPGTHFEPADRRKPTIKHEESVSDWKKCAVQLAAALKRAGHDCDCLDHGSGDGRYYHAGDDCQVGRIIIRALKEFERTKKEERNER